MTLAEVLLLAPLALASVLASIHGSAGRHRRNR